MSLPEQAEPAHEQLPIALFDGVVLAVRRSDGAIFLSIADVCAALSLGADAQRRRIAANEQLHVNWFRVALGAQVRTIDCLLLEDVSLWLLTIQTRRVSETVRERLRHVQQYLADTVRVAFAHLVGLPHGPGAQVEDLHDLDRIDRAMRVFSELAERQTTIEDSQERARQAWRDMSSSIADIRAALPAIEELRRRVQELEQQAKSRISGEQRNTLYRLVQRWGEARAAKAGNRQPGGDIRKAWVEFNARFGVATYTDLPAGSYDAAVQFVKVQYEAISGLSIDAIEQNTLELE